MKKRLLSILLTLCMVLMLLPQAVFAEGSVTYLDAAGKEQTCSTYDKVTKDSTSWNDGWYVVQGEVTIEGTVTVNGDVHLILADNCTLTVNGGIDGTGNLTIYAQSTGDKQGSIMVSGPNSTEEVVNNYGIHVRGNMTINGGSVEAKGGNESSNFNHGIDVGLTFTINGGSVKAEGGHGSTGSYGIYANSVIINGGSVEAKGGTAGAGSYGILVSEKATINGGIVTAEGGEAEVCSYGIETGEMTITGGTVTAEGCGAGTDIRGIYVQQEITINGSAVVFASSIVSDDPVNRTNGIIFEGDTGKVYGSSVSPSADFTIPAGKTLTIEAGQELTIPAGVTLTIEEGATLTNNGTIYNGGTINGTVSGNQPKACVSVTYLDENGEEQTCSTAIALTDDSSIWGKVGETAWYVVQGDVAFGTGEIYQHVHTLGNAHLILTDGCTLTLAEGLTAEGDLTIYAQSTGDEQGRMSAYEKDKDESSLGIRVIGNFTINGGIIEAGSGNASDRSYGIWANNMTVNGGRVTATSSFSNSSAGIYVEVNDDDDSGSMTISGGSVTATGGASAFNSFGIFAGKELIIEGSTVKAEGGSAEDSTGIYAHKQLTIEDSTVKVKSSDAEEFSKGIATFGSVTISGGSVEVRTGTAKTSSIGILAPGGVTITDGSHVTIHAPGNGTNGHATNKSPQLPEAYWWRTADTDPFTASGTAAYVHSYDNTYVEFTDSFTVTLDPNYEGGESGTMTTGTDGKLLETLPVLTRDGYTFEGWFAEAEGGTAVTGDTVFNGYVTIHARWTANTHSESTVSPAAPSGWKELASGTVYYKNGLKVKGLQQIGGKTYYFDEKGYLQTGWVELDGCWYYFADDMQTGWQKLGGRWYFLDPDTGVMAESSWVLSKGVWYYLGGSGAMLENQWVQWNGVWYYLGEGGAMLQSRWLQWNDAWYYLGTDGAMLANRWLQWNGAWYYLGTDGVMLTNTVTPDGYKVDANGVWVK